MSKYPQHDKLEPLQEQSQTCGEFIQWMRDKKGWFLAAYAEKTEECQNCGHKNAHLREAQTGFRCASCTCADYFVGDRIYEAPVNLNKVLAEFFGIEYDELQAEKDRMLVDMRKAQGLTATGGRKE